MNSLFGPLNEKYCNVFLFLSVFSFSMVVITLLVFLGNFVYFLNSKHHNIGMLFFILFITSGYVINYLSTRLLYNMCKMN